MKTFLSIIDVDEFKSKTIGKTWREIASICGVAHSTISNIFNGHSSLLFQTAFKISAAFDLHNTKFNSRPLKRKPNRRIHHIKYALFDRHEILNALLLKNWTLTFCANLCNITLYTLRSWLNGCRTFRKKALIIDKVLGLKNTKYFTVC